MRWAISMALYANTHRDPEQSSEYKPQEFLEMLPWRQVAEVAVDSEALLQKARELHALFKAS